MNDDNQEDVIVTDWSQIGDDAADSDEDDILAYKGIALLASLLPEGSAFQLPEGSSEEEEYILRQQLAAIQLSSASSSLSLVSVSSEACTSGTSCIPSIITAPEKILQLEGIVEEEHLDEMSSSCNAGGVAYPPSLSGRLSSGDMVMTAPSSSSTDSAHLHQVNVRPRPQVPPKPPIDTVRYSMNNLKESNEWQLDQLLEELSALETQLNSSSGDQLLLGIPTLPQASSNSSGASTNKLSNATTSQTITSDIHTSRIVTAPALASSCSSPDGDSAFGDSSSTESRNRNSAFSSSNDSCRDSLHTPSPTQISPRSTELTPEEVKAAKIKQALEKMKEAKVTRIFVKFFVEDGAPLQMLVDERWTVSEAMKQVAEKHQISLSEDHCIVEEYPDLYIRRIYEDHENLVENIQMWQQDSPNKLYFIRRPDKYPFIDRPELYLVTDKTTDLEVPQGTTWTREVKQQFVEEFFNRDTVVPPEMDGFLYLKADGRKSWKKYYFVLRPSGLYYAPKGKKAVSSKDLQCLMNLHSNQVYSGINWSKKYKSPTDYCISIKLTQLQVKRSQYIKYICCDDEPTFRKWIVALRIAKNGSSLYNNYQAACELRRNALNAAPLRNSVLSRVDSASVHDNLSVNTGHHQQPGSCSSSQHDLRLLASAKAMPSPSQISRVSQMTTGSDRSVAQSTSLDVYPGHNVSGSCLNLRDQSLSSLRFDEQPTGTIKRAPLDVIRRMSQSSSNDRASTAGTPDDDSDEDFPAPPPVSAQLSRTSTPVQNGGPPAAPPKPAYYQKPAGPPTPARQTPVQSPTPIGNTPKKVPPPPPKRSDATRIVSAAPHMNDLEAALARRREKLAQQV
ncbi:unnamed protein product [Auanema sp. JU1783]|nr:unnamed protein product [Auanema sp. JU1783]